ncbi:MAG: cyclic nucleotide-binding domain-containing protein, partial [Cyanobacteria bacterium J06642_3]
MTDNYFLMQATSEQLKTIIIFAQLESDFLAKLALGSKVQSYKKIEILIHEGDLLLPKLYAVLEGKLSAQKFSSSGKETILRQLMPGAMRSPNKAGAAKISPGIS